MAVACVVVIAFLALLPTPVARWTGVLPGLALLWFTLFGLTMLLQVWRLGGEGCRLWLWWRVPQW